MGKLCFPVDELDFSQYLIIISNRGTISSISNKNYHITDTQVSIVIEVLPLVTETLFSNFVMVLLRMQDFSVFMFYFCFTRVIITF